jgi:ribosomal protein S20
MQRQVVYMPPPAYYWSPPSHAPHAPPPWYGRDNIDGGGRSGSGLSLDDVSAGFSRLEGEVKRSTEDARRRGLSREVYVKQRSPTGVTKSSRVWDAIQLRVVDDDGAPQEYKKALMGEVLRIVDDVKSRLLSSLLPTHVAAAVGALDVLRQILRYYDAVVAGASEHVEPRYEAEASWDLKSLLAVTASNAKEIKEATKRAVGNAGNSKMTKENVGLLDEATRALFEAYKACDAEAAKLGMHSNSAKDHVNKLVTDTGFP